MKRLAILVALVGVVACGAPQPYPEEPPPSSPAPGQGGGGQQQPGGGGAPAVTFAAVKPTVDRVCMGCHSTQAPRLDSEAAFKTAKVRQEIESGSMPPGGRISAADKATLLGFLKG